MLGLKYGCTFGIMEVTMKMSKIVVCALGVVMLANSAFAHDVKLKEQELPFGFPSYFEYSFDYASRYMSEGYVEDPNYNYTRILTLGWSITDNLSFHIGGLERVEHLNKFFSDVAELDCFAGLSLTLPDVPGLGAMEFNMDYIYYNYPHDGAHTHDVDNKEYEIDINATELFLKPGIAFVHDFENDAIKANVNATYELNLERICKFLVFECPMEFWFGNHQYSGCTEHLAAYSLCISPALKIKIKDIIFLGVFTQMSWALDSDVRRYWKDDKDNNSFNMCWGLNFTISI